MSAIRQASDIDTGPITPVYALPIDHPSAWKPADFGSPADYTIELTASQLRDVDHAITRVKAASLGLDDLGREHFELPSLRPVIDEIRRQIEKGRGFVVVRRLPVEAYSKDDLGMIFWGIGTHLGRGLRISAARTRSRAPTATSRSCRRTPTLPTSSGSSVCAPSPGCPTRYAAEPLWREAPTILEVLQYRPPVNGARSIP
jgi:hypothetical protein